MPVAYMRKDGLYDTISHNFVDKKVVEQLAAKIENDYKKIDKINKKYKWTHTKYKK